MFGKMMKVVAFVAAMAVSGSAMAGSGKKLNLTPREITGVVNLNTATAKEIELLPGIGKRTADQVVAYREKSPFKAPHDLVKVKGIGEGTWKKVKNHVTITGPTTLALTGRKVPAAAEAALEKPRTDKAPAPAAKAE